MLDSDTKRRIDTARDILVGKVPDPKSQVEQITIALIYKFMDDMDAESEELGGKRKFFTKEFARYGWAQLMRPGLGGHEMLGLYAEGISKMPENPGIPALFREIFKNAYLPYRDPETLKAFLKIVDEFSYDHSERLGDAFEYLLSVLGSQGDAGQFRTPRHIIDFIVEIIRPRKGESILDPACGTAGFLISAYKYILRTNTDAKGTSKLTPEERDRLATNIKGYDISPDMVRLSLVNLYLHGFTDPHIYEYDTLTSEERWNDFADVILANPPFMSPKGGIKPHKRFSVPSNRSEVLFVDYMVEHLTSQGRAGIIVPEGVTFQSGTAYKRLREVLLKDSLIGVISLPSGVFQPYSGVKTSILILDKRIARSRPTILFSSVRAIGVSLGMKRSSIERNDLPDVVRDYAAYYAGTPVSSVSWLVERSAVIANGCDLSGERYRPVEVRGETRLVKLGDVCSLRKGTHSSTKTEAGPYPLIVTAEHWLSSPDYEVEGEAVCVPLISSTGHGRASIKRIHFASGKFAVANLLSVVQPKNTQTLSAKFLYHLLNVQKDNIACLMKGAANVSMKVEDLADFRIPLPSREMQKEIVAEIEGYQQVINGARTVIANYRPQIPVRPDWPMVELGYATKVTSGLAFGSKDFSRANPTKSIKIANVGVRQFIEDGENNLPSEFLERYPDAIVRSGDLVIALTRSIISGGLKVAIVPDSYDKSLLNQRVASIRAKEGRSDLRFIYPLLCSSYAYAYVEEKARSLMQPNLSIVDLKELKVPLPPLATQRAIAAEIAAEEELVAANSQLATRFEKKIQLVLSRVWGEEAPQIGEA